jgi:oxygen-independent coproporphyrinogen III oxidase
VPDTALPRSLYVHVPFCVRRCSYCDFAVQATPEAPVTPWLEAVTGELRLLSREQRWSAPLELDTVYVGGGTPSMLGTGAMAAMRAGFAPLARWDPAAAEWTAEANPESFTLDLARDWREAGVNRVSLGVQTFHEPALRWMGRMHGAEGPARAMAAARSAGFENVSVDLIFGLPSRLGRDWSDDLDRALALEPGHVSLYGLTAEQATPLGRWVREGRESLAGEDRYAEEYLLAHERLTAAGFEHYEVSNFGLPGLRSRHNFAYWTGVSYAALGPGAHGFHPPVRRWNLRGWEAYRDAVAAGELPLEGEERVAAEEIALERVWLALRTDVGYPLAEASPSQRSLAQSWSSRGLATLDGGTLRLTAEGWLLLDRLALDFAAAAGTEGRVETATRRSGGSD